MINFLCLLSAEKILVRAGISSKVDDSSVTLGKRYARTDECGIPFAVTVDQVTLSDETITVRELHSMKQIRLPIVDLVQLMQELSNGQTTWEASVEKYGLFENGEAQE